MNVLNHLLWQQWLAAERPRPSDISIYETEMSRKLGHIWDCCDTARHLLAVSVDHSQLAFRILACCPGFKDCFRTSLAFPFNLLKLIIG